MARPLRIHVPGGIIHVFSRGNKKADLFLDDQDWFRFMDIIVKFKVRYDFRIYAYCLMTNHWHMLIKAGTVSASKIFQMALSEYATYFNKRHAESGHVFQGRFGSRNVLDDRYFLGAARYIHLNPVEAGMVERPEDWRWSGYAEFERKNNNYKLMDYDLPMSIFSEDAVRSDSLYRDFMSRKSKPGPRGPRRTKRYKASREPILAY